MTSFAPIALFVYKRPAHTRCTLEALARNPEARFSTLHVFCDGPEEHVPAADRAAIAAVRRIVKEQKWCAGVQVHEREDNLGLAMSIRGGVSRMLNDHDRVIVLEDDIETSPGFLAYMNRALDLYAEQARVMHVSGYLPSTSHQSFLPESFFDPLMMCWGWATWRRAWRESRWDGAQLLDDIRSSRHGTDRFNFHGAFPLTDQLIANLEGRINTWAVFWAASIFLRNGLCLFPRKSLVQNIGTDGSGVHFTRAESRYHVRVADHVELHPRALRDSRIGRFYLRSFFLYGNDSTISRRLRCQLGRWKHHVAARLRSGPAPAGH